MSRKPSVPRPAYDRAGKRLSRDGELGWLCRVYDAKTRRQVQKTFYGTERAAVSYIESLRLEQAARLAPQWSNARSITVGQWAIEFLRRYRWKIEPVDGLGGVRRPETTWKNAKANLSAYILPGLGEQRTLRSVTHEDLHRLIATLQVADRSRPGKRKPADDDTKDKAASITRLLFKEAEIAGVIAENPASKLRTVWGQKARRARVVIPSIKQVEDLSTAMDEEWGRPHGDIVRVFAYVGFRWENLSALRLQDVDLPHRSIYVGASRPAATGRLVADLKGGGDDHYVTIIDEAVEPLIRLMKFADEHGSRWVICGVRGGPLSYGLWRKHLNKARAASGVPYTAHALRHVAASLLIAGGASIELVREQMDHSDSRVTQRVYRHALHLDRTEIAKRLRLPTSSLEVDDSIE